MTNLFYRLNDGTRVKTMSEAKASGQPYKVEYEPIPDFNTSTPGKYVGKLKKLFSKSSLTKPKGYDIINM